MHASACSGALFQRWPLHHSLISDRGPFFIIEPGPLGLLLRHSLAESSVTLLLHRCKLVLKLAYSFHPSVR